MAKREITDDERELLRRFVKLEITLDELMREFAGVYGFRFTEYVRGFTANLHLVEPGIEVTLDDVHRAVAAEAKGLISADELCRWVTMLLLNDALVWNYADDSVVDDLHALSMPAISGEKDR